MVGKFLLAPWAGQFDALACMTEYARARPTLVDQLSTHNHRPPSGPGRAASKEGTVRLQSGGEKERSAKSRGLSQPVSELEAAMKSLDLSTIAVPTSGLGACVCVGFVHLFPRDKAA